MTKFISWALPVIALLAACDNQGATPSDSSDRIATLNHQAPISAEAEVASELATGASQAIESAERGTSLSEDEDLIECARLQRDAERMRCYDALAIVRGYQPARTNVVRSGNWSVVETTNPIDDTRQVTLRLRSEPSSSTPRIGDRPIFVARCQSNQTESYIIWNTYVGDDSSSVYAEWKYVTIRVGTAPAERQQWGVSTDRRATFAPGWAGNLLRRMASTNSLIAQMTPYGESPMTAIFDTAGMAEALEPLMEACGWTLSNGPE